MWLMANPRVCDAYVEKMTELESERMQYENNKPEGAPKISDVFELSIKMLDAARKQIIGY